MVFEMSTIVDLAAGIVAIVAALKIAWTVIKWFQGQNKQTEDIEELRKKEADDVARLREELCLINYAMLACLDGLKQLGTDGKVTDAQEKLEKHLNKTAHNM